MGGESVRNNNMKHKKPTSRGDYGHSHTSSSASGGAYTDTATPTTYNPGGQQGAQPGHSSYSSSAPGHQVGCGAPQGQQQHSSYDLQAGFGGQSGQTGQGYGSPLPG